MNPHYEVFKAMRKNKLLQKPCEKCGSEDSIAHHPDYSKPTDIMWLCRGCHRSWHHQNKAKHKEMISNPTVSFRVTLEEKQILSDMAWKERKSLNAFLLPKLLEYAEQLTKSEPI